MLWWRRCGSGLLQLTVVHVVITLVKSTYLGEIRARSTAIHNRRAHYKSNDVKYSSSKTKTPPFSNDEVFSWLHLHTYYRLRVSGFLSTFCHNCQFHRYSRLIGYNHCVMFDCIGLYLRQLFVFNHTVAVLRGSLLFSSW